MVRLHMQAKERHAIRYARYLEEPACQAFSIERRKLKENEKSTADHEHPH
jgi:hypothetical protein